MLVKNLLKQTDQLLTFNSTLDKKYEFQLLLSNLLNKNIIEIIINHELKITEKKKKKFLKKIYFRNLGKPLSKIIGEKEFYSRQFFVNSFTLDPRPESELIVDCVKKLKKIEKNNLKILDLGTGSGCLLISIILEIKRKNIYYVATDKCVKALEVAEKNAKKFGIKKKINFIQSDWFSNIREKFDLIVSNPPYIKKGLIKDLCESVKSFDPYLSLNGGKCGLEAYKIIAKHSKKFLKSKGLVCVEIGYDQKKDVKRIFKMNDFRIIEEFKDLYKKDRVLIFENKI